MNYTEISAVKCLNFCEKFLNKNKISWYTTENKKHQIEQATQLLEISKLRKRNVVRLTSDEINFLKIK